MIKIDFVLAGGDMLGLPYNILKLVLYDAEWIKEYNEEAERIICYLL